MKNLLIIGAGGHGKVVLDIALSSGQFKKIAFLDDNKVGENILGYPVVGKIGNGEMLKDTYNEVAIAIGNNTLRVELAEEFKQKGYHLPTLIHPTAFVSAFTAIGEGTVVMPKAIVNTGAKVGAYVIINTGVVVEHDDQIGKGVHLSPNVTLGGTVEVGDMSWIGIGATVINNISIGKRVMVAAGAVVIKDIEDGQRVFGIPAKER